MDLVAAVRAAARRRADDPDQAEHRDRARLDLRLPDARGAIPEHARRPALRPLRGGEPQGPRRDLPARVLRAAAPARTRCRPRRSRRRRTSSRRTRISSRGYERIYSLHLSAKLSGTFQSAALAGAELGGDRVVLVDTETASLAVAMLALAIQRRLARGTTDEEIDGLIERFKRDDRRRLHASATLEYLQKGGRIGRAQALAGTLLNVKPILGRRGRRGRPGRHACAAGRRRSRSSRACSPARRERRAGTPGRDRPRERPGVGRRDHRLRHEDRARTPRSSSSRRSAPSSAPTPGPGAVGFFWFQDSTFGLSPGQSRLGCKPGLDLYSVTRCPRRW